MHLTHLGHHNPVKNRPTPPLLFLQPSPGNPVTDHLDAGHGLTHNRLTYLLACWRLLEALVDTMGSPTGRSKCGQDWALQWILQSWQTSLKDSSGSSSFSLSPGGSCWELLAEWMRKGLQTVSLTGQGRGEEGCELEPGLQMQIWGHPSPLSELAKDGR